MPALGAFCKCKSTSVSCLKVVLKFILLCTYNIALRCDVWWLTEGGGSLTAGSSGVKTVTSKTVRYFNFNLLHLLCLIPFDSSCKGASNGI